MVLIRRAGHGVHAYANDAADENVARNTGDARTRELRLYFHLLRLIPRLGERRDEFLILFHGQRTGRDASQSITCSHLSLAGLRVEADVVRCSASDCCAPTAQCGERQNQDDTHLPPLPLEEVSSNNRSG